MNLKTIGLILAGAILLFWTLGKLTSRSPHNNGSTVAASSSTQAPAASWQVSEGQSAMDDSKTVTLSLDSVDVIQGPLGPSRPALVIRCEENKTDVYVVTGMAADVEDDNLADVFPNHHTVRLRLDQESPQTVFWSASNDDKELFAGDGEQLAKELAEAQTLTFEFTPLDANPAVSQFDLTGLDTQLPKVADACGWNLN